MRYESSASGEKNREGGRVLGPFAWDRWGASYLSSAGTAGPAPARSAGFWGTSCPCPASDDIGLKWCNLQPRRLAMLRAVPGLAGFLAVCLGGFCQAADAPKIVAAGEWSKPVTDDRGYAVRGRLMLCEKMLAKDRPDLAVYVELQDATESIGAICGCSATWGSTTSAPSIKKGSSANCGTRPANRSCRPRSPSAARSPGRSGSPFPATEQFASVRVRSASFGPAPGQSVLTWESSG